MHAPSPPLARALALAILGALLFLGYFLGVQPLIDTYRAESGKAAQLELQVARYETVARQQSARRTELAALKQQQQVARSGALEGSNETLVAAQIQNRIKALVASGQGELVSTEILPAQEDGNFRRIGVRSQLSITMAGALQVFHGLEAQSPLLFLDNVELHAQAEIRRRVVSTQTPYAVTEVRFDVYGYMRHDALEPTAPSGAARRGDQRVR
jgi:general secretion pathway protein M